MQSILNLRSLRISRGFTLEEVSAQVGIDPTRLSRVERGEAPSWESANKLAAFYGVTLDEAFKHSSTPAESEK